MSAKPWITPSEAEKVAKKVAEEVVKEAQPGGSNVVANPDLEGDEPELEGLEINGDKFKIPAGGSGSDIAVNVEEEPASEILRNILVDGKRFDVNSFNPESMLEISATIDENLGTTTLAGNPIFNWLNVNYGENPSNWPTYGILVNLYVENKTTGNAWSEYGYLYVNIDTQTISYEDLYHMNSYEFIGQDLSFEGIIAPAKVLADVAPEGAEVEVEEIQNLWLPDQQKFVKFAGGGSGSIQLYTHNIYFKYNTQYYHLQYKSFNGEPNTYAADLCAINHTGHENYIWQQWFDKDALLEKVTKTEHGEDEPIDYAPSEVLVNVVGAYAYDPETNPTYLAIHTDDEGTPGTISMTSNILVEEIIEPAFDHSTDDTSPYWPWEIPE